MQKSTIPKGSLRRFGGLEKEVNSYCWPDTQKQDDKPCLIIDGEQGIYCTLESSSIIFSDHFYGSSSISISCNGSSVSRPEPESSSPDFQSDSQNIKNCSLVKDSFITNDTADIRHKLWELETIMLGPDSYNFDSWDAPGDNPGHIPSETERWKHMVDSRGNLKELLIATAKAVSNNDLSKADWLMSELRHVVSISGKPIQRLGAYMLEGLVARLSSSGSSIYNAMMCKKQSSGEPRSYMHLLYEACPYFKFGHMSANGAIAEAMKNENRIHIIDFQIAQGSQWVSLIKALAARPGGCPQIRMTSIDYSTSEHAPGGGPNIVGKRLSGLANACSLPFEFCAAKLHCSEFRIQNLVLQPGEAVAVNFPFMLHHIPDESVNPENQRDTLLRLVKSWSPKVVTLVEQESNTNTAPFFPRFLETLDYYSAIFESMDVTLPRDCKERVKVEQHCLARDIVNIIACEGAERVERHEVLGKWRYRFLMAGFRPYPLSPIVNATIRALLRQCSWSYRLEERDGALYLGWMNRALVSSCAWQ